ncbi:MAG: TolC family protein [Bacillota bacterium]|jgi:outer membrane protein TolC|nr:TolC family protein [Bacillota bacterium]HOB92239.1 TolC family protein [Bacillota bacterium]HPZ55304.1 TolC family protein [Bacillota bacterium]HQD18648.1 TolC family protein [Bacillota bacterium]
MRSKLSAIFVVVLSILLLCNTAPLFASDQSPAVAGVAESKAAGGASLEGTDVGGGVLEIALVDYVNAYILNSDSVESAQKQLDKAVESWERAVAEKRAALTIEELANAAETARLALAEAKNSAAIQAIQVYFNLGRTIKDTESARASLAVANERVRITRLRHEAGFATADQLLQQENSYLSAVDSLIKAEQNLDQAIESFCLDIGMDPVGEVVLLTDISSLYSDVPDLGSDELLEAAQAASSSYYSALKAEELARKKYNALQDPLIATRTEREDAETALEDAVKKLENASKSLSDSVRNALAQLDALIRALEMQEKSVQISDNSLEIARIRFEHGEAYQYELDNEVNSNISAHNRLKAAQEDLYLQILRVYSLAGEDVVNLIRL